MLLHAYINTLFFLPTDIKIDLKERTECIFRITPSFSCINGEVLQNCHQSEIKKRPWSFTY